MKKKAPGTARGRTERNQRLAAFSVRQHRIGSQRRGGDGTQNRFFCENTEKILRKKEDDNGGDGNENVKDQNTNTKEQKKPRE